MLQLVLFGLLIVIELPACASVGTSVAVFVLRGATYVYYTHDTVVYCIHAVHMYVRRYVYTYISTYITVHISIVCTYIQLNTVHVECVYSTYP